MNETLQSSCLSKGIQRCGFHVCVLGVIGSGKTTNAKALQEVILKEEGRCEGLWEPVGDNPILPLFYQDQKRYAFSMQIYMLNRRFEQQKLAQSLAFTGISSVQDSSLFGDSCFVEMLRKDEVMSKEEIAIYSSLFANMSREVMYPSLIVYLDCDPHIAKERIIKRGRECEKNISIEYLSNLKSELDILINEFEAYTNVIRIDAGEDKDETGIEQQAEMIYKHLCELRKTPKITRMGL